MLRRHAVGSVLGGVVEPLGEDQSFGPSPGQVEDDCAGPGARRLPTGGQEDV